MVTMVKQRALLSIVVAVLVIILQSSCDPSALVARGDRQISVGVILTKAELDTNNQYPLTAYITVASHLSDVIWVAANEFTIVGQSSGKQFIWNRTDTSTSAASYRPYVGNYALPDSGYAGVLGRNNLEYGESYTLRLVVDGNTIEGVTTMPWPPELTVSRGSSTTTISWRQQAGVTYYEIIGIGSINQITADTQVVIPNSSLPAAIPDWIPPRQIRIRALDRNLAAFLRNGSLAASGISSGYGVFGSASSSYVNLKRQ